jgi:hypothetical protein
VNLYRKRIGLSNEEDERLIDSIICFLRHRLVSIYSNMICSIRLIYLVVASDYECLTQMNSAAFDKYNRMYQCLQHVNNSIRTMNDTNGKRLFSTRHLSYNHQ